MSSRYISSCDEEEAAPNIEVTLRHNIEAKAIVKINEKLLVLPWNSSQNEIKSLIRNLPPGSLIRRARDDDESEDGDGHHSEWDLPLGTESVFQHLNSMAITYGPKHYRSMLAVSLNLALHMSVGDKSMFMLAEDNSVTIYRGGDRLRKINISNCVGHQKIRHPLKGILRMIWVPKFKIIIATNSFLQIKFFDANLEELASKTCDKPVLAMEFVEERDEIVSGGMGHITVWGLDKFKETRKFSLGNPRLDIRDLSEDEWITHISYMKGRNRLIAAYDNNVAIYDYANGARIETMREIHNLPITALLYIPRVEYIVTGAKDGIIRVWNIHRHLLYEYGAVNSCIVGLGFISGRTPFILSCTQEGEAKLWSVEKSAVQHTWHLKDECVGVGVIEEALFYTATKKGLTVWNTNNFSQTFNSTQSKVTHIERVHFPGYAPRILIASEDGAIRLISPVTGQTLRTALPPMNYNIFLSVHYDIVSERIMALTEASSIIIWDAATNPCPIIEELANDCIERCTCMTVVDLSFRGEDMNVDNRLLVIGGMNNGQLVHLKLNEKGKKVKLIQGHSAPVTKIVSNNELLEVYSTADDGVVKGWKVVTKFPTIGKKSPIELVPLFQFDIGRSCVSQWAFSPSLGGIGIGLDNRSLFMQKCEKNEIIQKHLKDEEHVDFVTGMDYLPSLEVFVTSSVDKTVKLWDQRMMLLRELHFGDPVTAIKFLNSRGDLLLGCASSALFVKVQDYIPPSYLRQLAELDFIDDDLEFPIHFNSDLDFWNYYHEKLGAVTFWHVGKDLAKSAAKFDGLAPVSIQLSNIDLADREGNKQRNRMRRIAINREVQLWIRGKKSSRNERNALKGDRFFEYSNGLLNTTHPLQEPNSIFHPHSSLQSLLQKSNLESKRPTGLAESASTEKRKDDSGRWGRTVDDKTNINGLWMFNEMHNDNNPPSNALRTLAGLLPRSESHALNIDFDGSADAESDESKDKGEKNNGSVSLETFHNLTAEQKEKTRKLQDKNSENEQWDKGEQYQQGEGTTMEQREDIRSNKILTIQDVMRAVIYDENHIDAVKTRSAPSIAILKDRKEATFVLQQVSIDSTACPNSVAVNKNGTKNPLKRKDKSKRLKERTQHMHALTSLPCRLMLAEDFVESSLNIVAASEKIQAKELALSTDFLSQVKEILRQRKVEMKVMPGAMEPEKNSSTIEVLNSTVVVTPIRLMPKPIQEDQLYFYEKVNLKDTEDAGLLESVIPLEVNVLESVMASTNLQAQEKTSATASGQNLLSKESLQKLPLKSARSTKQSDPGSLTSNTSALMPVSPLGSSRKFKAKPLSKNEGIKPRSKTCVPSAPLPPAVGPQRPATPPSPPSPPSLPSLPSPPSLPSLPSPPPIIFNEDNIKVNLLKEKEAVVAIEPKPVARPRIQTPPESPPALSSWPPKSEPIKEHETPVVPKELVPLLQCIAREQWFPWEKMNGREVKSFDLFEFLSLLFESLKDRDGTSAEKCPCIVALRKAYDILPTAFNDPWNQLIRPQMIALKDSEWIVRLEALNCLNSYSGVGEATLELELQTIFCLNDDVEKVRKRALAIIMTRYGISTKLQLLHYLERMGLLTNMQPDCNDTLDELLKAKNKRNKSQEISSKIYVGGWLQEVRSEEVAGKELRPSSVYSTLIAPTPSATK